MRVGQGPDIPEDANSPPGGNPVSVARRKFGGALRLAERRMNHQQLANVVHGEQTHQHAIMKDRRGTAFCRAHCGEGFLQHLVRIYHYKIAIHHVTDRRFISPLREGPHQVLTRQHAQHVIAEDHGEILLPSVQDVFDRLGQRIVGLEGSEMGQHGLLHGDSAQRVVHLDHGRFLLGAHPNEEGDENQERVSEQSRQAKQKGDDWPTRAAISVARAYSRRVASRARSTRPPSMGKAGIGLNASNQTFTTINLFRKLPPVQRKAASSGRTPIRKLTPKSLPAMTAFTAGPASATQSS